MIDNDRIRLRIESKNGICNWDATIEKEKAKSTVMINPGQENEYLKDVTIGQELLEAVNDAILRFEKDGKVFAKDGERRVRAKTA